MRLPLGMSKRSSGMVTAVVTALIALGTWYLQQQGGAAEPQAEPTASYSVSASVSPSTPLASDSPTYAADEATDPDSGLPYVEEADLPPEAVETLRLIDQGGPFPYDRDGITFENREGILPDQAGGYYQEYTVETPGEDDRGARRIVVGDGGEYYWTEDHYESFSRIKR